ncbi:hypothetical protein GCM10011514_25260 [Emticicia aquatilis]|uniref:Redox-active disulfide protein 2 n=1 Tax=Emticicia aquatilis TaxID=1537369 RepID=A0A917DQS9_9BACT|nr:hypothetical protein [Emticicia aquatilis]GGD60248.1 hypothetical protein GCM10011514_25260 [Emticicia aquatilis]
MKENPYAKLSLDELKTKAKNLKKATSIFTGILMVLIFAVVFLAIRQGFSMMTLVPTALLPMLIINIMSLNTIQKEIQSRKS